jgi:hypothetical protein
MAAARFLPLIATFTATTLTPGALLAQQAGAPDYIAECRSGSDDAASHIACLEAAISALTADVDGDEITQADHTPAPVLAEGLGAEQVLARRTTKGDDAGNDRADEKVDAAVTEFAQTPSGAYVFFLDNGQVWRQKRADSNRIRLSGKVNYTVTVSEGAISGYRLKVNEIRRTLLVERIK